MLIRPLYLCKVESKTTAFCECVLNKPKTELHQELHCVPVLCRKGSCCVVNVFENTLNRGSFFTWL